MISIRQTKVHDQDGTSPNNKFTATTDKNCPLEATGTSYTSGQNAAPVVYQLRESLDFENAEQIECQVTFQVSLLRKVKVKKPEYLIGFVVFQILSRT